MTDEDYESLMEYLMFNDPVEAVERLRIADSILRCAFPDHYKSPDDPLDNWEIDIINLDEKQIAYLRELEGER
jgi:hypothetical protein